ncbi:hypothetical protein KBY85_11160 [Cyanobium sp. BA5m-10]|nr:hypothetical protein [Cyanobium sp. BA5m-10]
MPAPALPPLPPVLSELCPEAWLTVTPRNYAPREEQGFGGQSKGEQNHREKDPARYGARPEECCGQGE